MTNLPNVLIEYSVNTSDLGLLERWIKSDSETRINALAALIEAIEQQKKGRKEVYNPNGFLKRALEQNWKAYNSIYRLKASQKLCHSIYEAA